MPLKEWVKRRWLWLAIGIPIALVVLVVGGTYVYIHFIEADPPPRLTFSTETASADPADPAGPVSDSIDGTWKATDASVVGYRVNEVLFGQDNEAAGRTNAVTGDMAIAGTTVNTASFTVDMTQVSSDSGQRDGQFRNRIMQTSQFPTATFELTQPLLLPSVPANLQEITVQANGKLTLHGVTKDITADLKARRNGANIEVNGTIPITFSDYGISNPSGGPATVGDNGEIELLLVFAKA
jgi:polyisoprenoid-binding protein YceI